MYFDCTKCRSRSDQYKHNVFEFHGFALKLTRFLYVHRRHICACPTYLNIGISFPSEVPKDMFKEYASDPHQTTQCKRCDVLGLRKCASIQGISLCAAFAQKHAFHNLRFNIHRKPILDFAAHMPSSKCTCG